jgi:hypothetical protein
MFYLFLIKAASIFIPLDIEHQQSPRTKQTGVFLAQQAEENNNRPMD